MKTRKNHFSLKKKNQRKKQKQTQNQTKNAGMLKAVLSIVIGYTLIYSANGYAIYTACRGNTCRSPYYQTVLRNIFDVGHYVGSFGTYPKTIGSPMAPETTKYAIESCAGDSACIARVNAHSSREIDCSEIKEHIRNGEKVIIIPMDEQVELSLKTKSIMCFNERELNSIHILDNANITDPFPFQGTPLEKEKYLEMKNGVESHVATIFDKLKKS
jgi:protein-tyrosine-phosphatase